MGRVRKAKRRGRKRIIKRPREESVLGVIIFKGNNFYKEEKWEIRKCWNVATNEDIVRLRRVDRPNEGVAWFSSVYPGFNKQQAHMLGKILLQFSKER